jgi:integrase
MEHVGRRTKLQNISARHAEPFIASRLFSDLEPATVNKDIRTLKSLFNLAIEPRGCLPQGANPFRQIKARRKTEESKRDVSPNEYGAPAGVVQNTWWRTLIALAYGAGFRRGEMSNLTWGDIDFEGHAISGIKTTPRYYLIVHQEDMEKARGVNSTILGQSPTDPLGPSSGSA